MMSSGGGDAECASARWRSRCIYLVILFEFLSFSVGSADPSNKESTHNLGVVSGNAIPPTDLRDQSNDHSRPPSGVHVYFLSKVNQMTKSQRSVSTGGLQKLFRRFINARQLSFEIDGNMISWEGATLQVRSHQRESLGEMDDAYVERTGSASCRRLLATGSTRRHRRPSLRNFWALQRHQQQQRKGRRVAEEAFAYSEGQQTQQANLGPPAPPSLVHNEKQDWNQDYAEPDVHPPSSN